MKKLNQVVEDISSLKVQGAKQIAVVSLKFLKGFSKKNGFGPKFTTAMNKLEKARPTAVVLHNCLEILRKDKSTKTINKLLGQLTQATKNIGLKGSKVVKNKYKIMTHCHSGEALSVIKQAWKDGKKFEVYATETEPKHQGIITAKELHKLGIPVTIIEDPANGFFMKDMDIIIVGSDALRKEGVVNKIGTYPLALLAKTHKKKFYVVGNTFKIDNRKKITIEERSAKEVYTNLRGLKGIKIRNPAFDTTPWKYVYRVINEKGIFTPTNALRSR